MNSRFIGGILLIVGTSIGGGMLALPIANAATGFWQSSLFLFLCWVIMTLGAFFILEVNLYLPPGKNMVSMAAATLGKPGLLVAWVSYLLLLYALLSAYISGGSDVMGGILKLIHIQLPPSLLTFIFTAIFGFIVYGGIRKVDLLNRLLMFAKIGAYLLLLVFITPYTTSVNFRSGNMQFVTGTIMILITSYGFAIIVPSLREYFNDDIKVLKKLILIGSLIPLVCYIAWDAVIMGTLGDKSLSALMHDPHATSTLALLLSNKVNNDLISTIFNFFTSICMLTAFLGVALCLISFLGDGLKLAQEGREGLGLFLLTFLPPLLIVIFYPGAYIHALNYAGFLCVVLLLLMPAMMSYFGRKHFDTKFVVPGGKYTQLLLMLSSVVLILVAL